MWHLVTDTDLGDPEIVDFGRFRPIIGLDSATKALLRLPELVCVSPAVFPDAWYTWPRFVGLKSSKNTDFGPLMLRITGVERCVHRGTAPWLDF